MRSAYILAFACIFGLEFLDQALAQERKTIVEGAQSFCAEKYGDRLLGVTLADENRFTCRYAAVERAETYQLPPPPAQPIWDLDD